MNTWNHAWIVLILIFGGGLIVSKLTEKPRIPDVAAYLLYGILIGPAILNWVYEPSQSQVNQLLLNLGATLILFDGGRGVRLSVLKQVWISILMLATVGVVVSAAIVALSVHYLLGLPWLYAMLMGSVIASTDPATLIPVFERVSIIPRLQQTVESESAFNDATGAVLTFTILGLITSAGTHFSIINPIWSFLESAIVGLVVGVVLGFIGLWLVSQKGMGIFHEYGSIIMLVIALSSYEVATLFHASGFMAAFTAGVLSGNGQSFRLGLADHTEENVHHFGSAITLILRMMVFVLLGTQVNFGVVSKHLWMGLLVIAIFMLVGRPLTVLSSVLVDKKAKWGRKEIAFMCWVRETGIIPAALSGMLLAQKLPHADIISALTFLAILCTIVIQASTTDFAAKLLGVLRESEIEEI